MNSEYGEDAVLPSGISVNSISVRKYGEVSLNDYLAALRNRIEQQLQIETDFPTDCPSRLGESIRYSLLAPGKRIRPCLVLMACEAVGGQIESALPAACALEMIHCYSLIHDDLPAMDDDDLRRGRPTNHKQFDESTAILAGDGLLTEAFAVLARGVRDHALIGDCVLDLANAAGVCGMVGGQQADLEAEQQSDITLEQLESIHRRKTGQLLIASLRLGGRIGGATPEILRSLTVYGENIGLAFQIADDLLDVCGDQEKMGKQVQKDASLGKQTYPSLLGVEASRQRAESLVQSACAELSSLGQRADHLRNLARYIIDRDH